MDKYKINYYLERLTNHQYKKAIRVIPKALGVSKLTFYYYRKIQIGDRLDIPYEKVKILEVILSVSGGLENYVVNAKKLSEIKEGY